MMYINTDDIKKFINRTVDDIIEEPSDLKESYGILIGKFYALYDLLNEEKD